MNYTKADLVNNYTELNALQGIAKQCNNKFKTYGRDVEKLNTAQRAAIMRPFQDKARLLGFNPRHLTVIIARMNGVISE